MRSEWPAPRSPRSTTPAGWPDGTYTIVRRVRVDAEQISADPRSRRRRTIDPGQLALALEGTATHAYAVSFIVTNIPANDRPGQHTGNAESILEVEAWFRRRTDIEDRIREAKLGAALRKLPSGDPAVNTVWMWAALIAGNLSVLLQALTGIDQHGRAHAARLRHELLADPGQKTGSLSILATFGAATALFQWGWLSGLFGFDTGGPIMSFMPIIVIGILYGLAMDYEVFLVSSVREAHIHGQEARQSVVHGFDQAAGSSSRPPSSCRGLLRLQPRHHDQTGRFRSRRRHPHRRVSRTDDPRLSPHGPFQAKSMVATPVARPPAAEPRGRGREARDHAQPAAEATRRQSVVRS